MPGSPPSPRWRLLPAGALSFRQLDDDWLVFNALSGDTHLLTAAGHALIQALAEHGEQGCSAQTIAFDDAALAEQLQRSFVHFAALGLIERLDS